MTALKEFDSLLKSLLYIVEDVEVEIKNSDGVCKNFTVNEMHCIDLIAKRENLNVTKLSKALNLTRGGVSRLIKKLITKGAVETYTNQNNRKEIYFKLSSLGKKVFLAHKRIHRAYHKQDANFFKQFAKSEVEAGINFIKKYIEHTQKMVKK